MKQRIKILYRKSLKMSEGKLAAQCVHVALGLSNHEVDEYTSVVVLGVSDKKFREERDKWLNKNPIQLPFYIQTDLGYTEIPADTETCLAFLENDPRS